MITWLPQFALQAPTDIDAAGVTKLGGLPWGLPAELWPVCAQCDEPMALAAQLPHSQQIPRIPPAHSLFAFRCNQPDGACSFWEADSSANACLLVAHADLGAGPVPAPGPCSVIVEVWITDWASHEDGIDPEQEQTYYRESEIFKLPEGLDFPYDFDWRFSTKAGGVPSWTGNGPVGVEPEWRVLFQLSDIEFDAAPEVVARHAAQFDRPGEYRHDQMHTGSWIGMGNLCSDGILYVIDRTPDAPQPDVIMLINR